MVSRVRHIRTSSLRSTSSPRDDAIKYKTAAHSGLELVDGPNLHARQPAAISTKIPYTVGCLWQTTKPD